eukprot:3407271-Rhodomonas_salina.2
MGSRSLSVNGETQIGSSQVGSEYPGVLRGRLPKSASKSRNGRVPGTRVHCVPGSPLPPGTQCTVTQACDARPGGMPLSG